LARPVRQPVVLWSGGKDSTAMLHLIRYEVGVKLPCVQWREPRFRSRYAHSDRLANAWDLEMYDWTLAGLCADRRLRHRDGAAEL
jgi:diphthamide synthase (EF-2-diphthine--ammonia ligase)